MMGAVSAVALVLLASATTAGVVLILAELRHARHERVQLRLLALFVPSVARVETEPRELVPWARSARLARRSFPDAFRALDEAAGHRFPFSTALIEGVHARWTSHWLAWERGHDVEYRRRADDIEAQFAGADDDQVRSLQARLAQTEQEKLQRYQERYEEYVRIGKAIGDLEDDDD